MAEKTSIKIKPVGFRVALKRIEEEETHSGIILPDSAKKKPETAEVIALGSPKILENGTEQPLPVEIGNRVLVDKYAGQEITIDDEEFIIVRADDIIAIVE